MDVNTKMLDTLKVIADYLQMDGRGAGMLRMAQDAIESAEALTAMPQDQEEPGEERWFRMTYAYDEPRYYDFVVPARSASEAEALAQAALDAGVFADIEGESDNSASGHRVFVETADYPEAEAVDYARLVDGKLVEG